MITVKTPTGVMELVDWRKTGPEEFCLELAACFDRPYGRKVHMKLTWWNALKFEAGMMGLDISKQAMWVDNEGNEQEIPNMIMEEPNA